MNEKNSLEVIGRSRVVEFKYKSIEIFGQVVCITERDADHSIFYVDVSKGTSIVVMNDKAYPVGLTKDQLDFYPVCVTVHKDPVLIDWTNNKIKLLDNVFVSGDQIAIHKIRVHINGKKKIFDCIIVDGTDVKLWNPDTGIKNNSKLLKLYKNK